jgi:hypothetical protein
MGVREEPSVVVEPQVRLMLRAALLIFVYTVVVGILNGLDVVEFSRPQLLTHLHSGTLGWMTLAILAATLWLFADGRPPNESSLRVARGLAYLAPAAIALFVLTFALTAGRGRAVAGAAAFVVLVGFAAWTLSRVRHVPLSVPRLLVLVGLTTSVLGGLFGVLVGMAMGFGWDIPASFYGAHPSTMEVGFTIPVAMALAEWGLRPSRRNQPASRPGKLQVALMFLAFVAVLTADLAGQAALVGIGTMIATAGLVVFFARLWSSGMHTPLTRRGPERHALLGGLLVGAAIVYISIAISAVGGDFMQLPRGQLVSFVHLLAVGGTTNALLAFVITLSRRHTEATVADDLIFWALNIGVVGFVVALTIEVRGLVMVFAPLMGFALLLAVGVHVAALGRHAAGTPSGGSRGGKAELQEPARALTAERGS